MRLQLLLNIEKFRDSKPELMFNYQYPLSAALYSVFNSGDSEFARFLHEKGYSEKALSFKFFTFSQLYMPKYKLTDTGFKILSDRIKLIVSILPPKPAETFVKGLFAGQEIKVGNLHLKVQSVEVVAEPEYRKEMQFKTLSPIIISHKKEGSKHAEYIHPGDARFGPLLQRNLENKHRIYAKYNPSLQPLPDDYEFQYKAGNKIQKKRIKIKEGRPEESSLIVYRTDFKLKAPEALMKIGYGAGFGEKNALGLGCCEIINK